MFAEFVVSLGGSRELYITINDQKQVQMVLNMRENSHDEFTQIIRSSSMFHIAKDQSFLQSTVTFVNSVILLYRIDSVSYEDLFAQKITQFIKIRRRHNRSAISKNLLLRTNSRKHHKRAAEPAFNTKLYISI